MPSTRFGMVILWFYGAVAFYTIRSNFGVSIVCMTIDPVENVTTFNDTTDVMSSDDQCEIVSQDAREVGKT